MNNLKIINKSHCGVYAILLKNKSILLVRKSRGPYTGKLDLPGGKPEHGETLAQTVAREVLEETGLIVHKAHLFNNYSTVAFQRFESEGIQDAVHHIGMVYIAIDYDDAGLIEEMDAEDSLGAQWYAVDSLPSDELSPFALYAITDIKKLNV